MKIKNPATAGLLSVLLGALLMGACDTSVAAQHGGPAAPAAPDPGFVQARAVNGAAPSSAPSNTRRIAPQSVIRNTYTVVPDDLMINGFFNQGLTGWNVGDAVLANSELRPGAQALNVGWMASQPLGATTLVPHYSYILTVKARNTQTVGSAQIAVTFRMPSNNATFRVYATAPVTSNVYQTYSVNFTAPEYAATADVSIVTNHTRVLVDDVTLKMRSALATTERITSPVNSYVPAGYSLAFNDEFNGTALNTSKWFTRYIYANGTLDHLNDEQQRYTDNNTHTTANGLLNLTASKVSSSDPNGINYESGMIRSDWTARYGYFEARVKMPPGIGVWPAFWLNSDVSSTGRLSWPPEIDIFEFVNNGVEDLPNMIHSAVSGGDLSPYIWSDPSFNTALGDYIAAFDFTAGWHTFGAEWDANTVTAYVDGKKLYTRTFAWNYSDGTPAGPAHILLNLAVGGAWAGRHGIDDSAFPQALQVDWVRAYQKTL